MTTTKEVANHYTNGELMKVIESAAQKAGIDLMSLEADALAPVDEFHIRGREATKELLELVDFDPSTHLIDIGSGLGGAARYLAHTTGCKVTGIDLTPEFCEVATTLTERSGLDNQVEHRVADALDLPFSEASFDAAWMQHVSMNIADKATLLAEVHRVLKPNGTLVLYEVGAGKKGEVVLPVPWARTESTNHVTAPEKMRELAEDAGFAVSRWRDVTEESLAWFRRASERLEASGPPPLGLHVLLGSETPQMFRNMGRNLEEGRVCVYQGVLKADS